MSPVLGLNVRHPCETISGVFFLHLATKWEDLGWDFIVAWFCPLLLIVLLLFAHLFVFEPWFQYHEASFKVKMVPTSASQMLGFWTRTISLLCGIEQ